MPIFRLDTYIGLGRGVKAFFNVEGGVTRGPLPNTENPEKGRGGKQGNRKVGRPGKQRKRNKGRTSDSKSNGRVQTPEAIEHAEKIASKKREYREAKNNERASRSRAKTIEHKKKKKVAAQEMFRLEREYRAAEEGWAGDGPVTGALPDFLVIGVGKGGTTFLYHLLTQHPHVEPAATKEVHFFGDFYDEGVEWYRQNFPAPRQKDGRTTITGEATPYIANILVPERVAGVVPQARLIALLRNPVDRAYSRYHQLVRRERTTGTFEDLVEKEMALLLAAPQDGTEREEYIFETKEVLGDWGQALYKGLYVEHLARWSKFFDDEQMLVLKSEDFFDRPREILQQVFGFLGLPEWEPDPSVFESKRNTRKYEKMDPETRRKLEEFFEPHNKRLYEYLGRDLGW